MGQEAMAKMGKPVEGPVTTILGVIDAMSMENTGKSRENRSHV